MRLKNLKRAIDSVIPTADQCETMHSKSAKK